MEEHFLKDFVSGERGGIPEPWYNPEGDCITYQTIDEAIVAQRVDEVLTIYRSFENGKAIGFQIKGIAAIVKRFGCDGIAVEFEGVKQEVTKISLYALLLAAYETGPKTIGRRGAYAAAFQSFSRQVDVQISESSLAIN